MTDINPGRIEDTDTYDGAVTALLKLDGSDVLLFYRQSDGEHRDRSARVVMRRSTDLGETWTEPTVVHDVTDRDTGEPSVVYDSTSGRIVLFDHAMNLVETAEHEHPIVRSTEAYRLESTDGGKTWSDPVRITDDLIADNPWPFGGYVETSRGLMTQFHSPSGIEVVFSSDGGQTWGGNRMVPEPINDDRRPVEPVPCAVTKDKVLLFGRDNAKGDFFAMRSDDGGATWGKPVFFNPTGGSTPCPIWVDKTNSNEITAVWGDRDDGFVYASTMSAELAWQDPSLLKDEPRKRIHKQVGSPKTASYWGGGAGDFGYPTMTQWGRSPHETMIVFYDEGQRPNLWRMTLY